MLRTSSLLSAGLLLAVAAQAQCPQGVSAGLVNWSSSAGYTATFGPDDEGISNPPIALTAFANFPMPGAVGNLDQLWINSNGEIYLTDSTLALTQPAGGALFGVNTLAEFQGVAGASPRVVVLGGDHEGSVVAGANWSVTVDQSVPGQVRVSWIDMSRYANTTDRFSFACTLFASGVMQFDYGNTFPTGFAARWVGVSVGNAEPSTAGSLDLTTLPSSPLTQGILYQNFAVAADWDLAGQSVLITPDLTPGNENYTVAAVVPYTPTPCASNQNYGTGCHAYSGRHFVQQFAGTPAAKAALDGNALLFSLTGTGYVASWVPSGGALYVAPSAATTLTLTDDSVATFSPTVPVPIPGGTAPLYTVSSNGVLTAGNPGNQGTTYTATLAAIGTATGLAWYNWRDFNPGASGSGQVKWEEVSGVVYVTYDGVYEFGTTNPATFQWQLFPNGDVAMVWVSLAASVNTTNMIVGCSLAGAATTAFSNTLTATPHTLASGILTPMTLSAAPSPRINPSTVVTYTANNLPEFVPTSGIYLSTLFLSVFPNPGGFDLAGILTTVPGCNAWILSLDLDLGAQVTFAPTASWNFTFNNTFFAPGNQIGAQAVALFDGSFPLVNGESGGFLLSNGVLSTTNIN